jgi:hypothetical protein
MADPQLAATQVQTPPPAAAIAARDASRNAARADRRAAAMTKIRASNAAPAEAAAVAAPTEAPKAAELKTEPAKLAAAKPPEPTEAPDPATERGLRAVEQARKKWLDEQAAHKSELEVQRAEVARLRKEAEGKVTSLDELKRLKPLELLSRLDHLTDDDFDAISRAAYARTKAGKVDPRAQAAAQEAERYQANRGHADELASVKAELTALKEEFKGEFTRRDQASFAERWVGDAIKAVPGDKPTLLSKLMAKSPENAKRELLLLGAELEKANDGEPPTHAEVVAEFEKRRRASLEEYGVDVEAMLAPPAPAKPEPAKARTLEVAATTLTRAENAPKTRAELRAHAIANLRTRQRATADQ